MWFADLKSLKTPAAPWQGLQIHHTRMAANCGILAALPILLMGLAPIGPLIQREIRINCTRNRAGYPALNLIIRQALLV